MSHEARAAVDYSVWLPTSAATMMRSLCVVASCLGIAQASSYDVETFGSTEAAIAQVEARHETFRGLQVRLLRDALCLSNSRQHTPARLVLLAVAWSRPMRALPPPLFPDASSWVTGARREHLRGRRPHAHGGDRHSLRRPDRRAHRLHERRVRRSRLVVLRWHLRRRAQRLQRQPGLRQAHPCARQQHHLAHLYLHRARVRPDVPSAW